MKKLITKILAKVFSDKKRKWDRSNLMDAVFDREAAIHEHDKFHLFSHNKWIILIVLLFIITDGIFIYQLIAEYSYQSKLQSMCCAATFAVIINTIPTITANLFKTKDKGKGHYIAISALAAVVLAVFATIFILRWNSQDVLYGTNSTRLSLLSDSLNGESSTPVFTAGQKTMTILLGLEPIATSILAFCLSYFEQGKRDKEYTAKIMNLLVQAELSNLDANNLELEYDQNRDLESYDSALRKLAHDDLKQQERITKEYIKMELAMALGTPEALSDMMEMEDTEGGGNDVWSDTEGVQ